MSTLNKPKPRYKVFYFDGAAPFICKDVIELIDQLQEADELEDIRIQTVMLTDEQMGELPEFQGP